MGSGQPPWPGLRRLLVQVETDLKIACLTASPVRSGRVALICFGGPGLAEAISWLQGERVSRAARRRYSHILLGS